jgi:hypothetical protein
MTATFTTTQLVELHSQGHRFITQVEGRVTGLAHLLADDAHHAATLAKVWVGKFDAPSAATYRILPNGKLNLIRFFDFNDVEAA